MKKILSLPVLFGLVASLLMVGCQGGETIKIGTNELIGTDPSNFKPWFIRLFNSEWKSGSAPAKWDGRAGDRIIKILNETI